MKIIVWGINYAPEVTGIAPYNTLLCEYLAQAGHGVRMVASFRYYPEWLKDPADASRLFRTDVLNHVPVDRCWQFVPRKPSALKRILHELTFVASSFLRILLLPRPDVYVVISPPLLLGAAAHFASRIKGAPFVFHVQDLQPDAASNMGMLSKGPLLRLLYALERYAYEQAARLSGISQGMLTAFERKGIPRDKLVLFPNGVSLPEPGRLPRAGSFRRRQSFAADDFIALYSGNLGVKHGLEIILQAAALSKNHKIRFVICGDGARRAVLESKARELGLSNLLFLPLQADREYLEMLVDANAYFVTQQPGSGALFFPSKLLKGLALAKAIVVVADEESDLTRAARDGAFARVVAPDRPEQLASTLAELAGDRQIVAELGEAGRKYVQRFEQGRILVDFEKMLGELSNSGQGNLRRSKSDHPGSESAQARI